jgi:rod shape-determining protein MreC
LKKSRVPLAHKRHYRSSARVHAVSVRDYGWKISFVLLFMLSFALMALSRSDNASVAMLRGVMADALSPVVSTIAAPIQTVKGGVAAVNGLFNLHTQNRALLVENEQLKRWQKLAAQLEAENQSLRALLHVLPSAETTFLSARVLGNTSGGFSHSVFINGGARTGIASDMAVMNNEGLLGRVVESGDKTARVLLITDLNSRISVIGEKSRERALAVGRNGPLLELQYVPEDSKLKVGEKLFTSGDAALMPAGIPVGVIQSLENGKIRVAPMVDWSRLDFVSLVAPKP